MEHERRILTWYADGEGAVTVAPACELRATPEGKLEGYAIVYGATSRDLGGFVEQIRAGAVELSSDVLATFNHDLHSILGRSSAGTLGLELDAQGLKYRLDLPDTGAGRDVRELVRRGDVRGSSFTFQTLDQTWTKRGKEALRVLNKIRVTEVGPVTLPAYPDTTVAVRSLAHGGPEGETEFGPAGTLSLSAAKRKLSILDLYVGRGEA